MPRSKEELELIAKAAKRVIFLLDKHNIAVRKWRTTASGCAAIHKNEIEIPPLKNVENIMVALHEIGHILKYVKCNYLNEFYAEQFALTEGAKLGLDLTDYEARAKNYVLMHLARAHARKLNLKNIPAKVTNWLGTDLKHWAGHRVWVYHYASVKAAESRGKKLVMPAGYTLVHFGPLQYIHPNHE